MEVLQVELGSLCGQKLVLPAGSGMLLMADAILRLETYLCLSFQELLKSAT